MYIREEPLRQRVSTMVVPMFFSSRSSEAMATISSLAWTMARRMMFLVSSLPTTPLMYFFSSRGTISMARLLATSPAAWPPMPSATRQTVMSGKALTSMESSLFSR